MTSRVFLQRVARIAAGPSLGLMLSACALSPPLSSTDRAALDSCRAEADRVYAAQNRYQLSERDSRDSPLSGAGPIGGDSQALSDRYHHSEMVTDCLNHSEAVPVTDIR